MRKLFPLLAVILLGILLLPGRVQARAYTEVFHSGKIDWLKGTAEAVGIAKSPPRCCESEPAEGQACRRG